MNQEETKDQVIIDWDEFEKMNEHSQVQFGLSLLESLNLDQAKEAFEKVISRNQVNIEAINHYTDILDQQGETKQLEQLLKKTLIPENETLLRQYDGSYNLFFKYAQVQYGEQSIKFYKLGITLLEAIIHSEREKGTKKPAFLLKDIADAHAAIAETYQTDLLNEKSSEKACTHHINLAFQYDPLNLDAFLQIANFHLNKENIDAAKQDLQVLYEQIMIQNQNDPVEEDFILNVSKLMVEVEQYQNATNILEKAVEANQQNCETIYMLAFSKWKLGNYNEAYQLAQGVLQMPDLKEDQEILTATKELVEELEKHDIQPQNNIEEDEWMDIE